MSLGFRTATLDDCDRLGALSLRAYPYPPSTPAHRAERYRSERIAPIDTVTIAERDGLMVGSMRRIPFTGWLGGVAVPVGGLASVAVAPEARQSGVAAALIRRHVEQLVERRVPWSFLYPFSPLFYAKQGWAPAARQLRWRLRPQALPRSRTPVRRVSLDDAVDRAAVQACYERHCGRTNGSLSRSADQVGWQHEGRFVVGVPAPHGLAGYLVYDFHAPSPRPQRLVVHEWVADDGAAERALLGFLAAQRDQADELTIDTSPDYPLSSLLENGIPPVENEELPDEHHGLATLASGLMARAIDLAGAARGRGYPGATATRGAVALRVEHDALVAGNVGAVTIVVDGGTADVAPGHAAGAPLVSGSIAPISAVLVGALRVEQAARLGLVTVEGDVHAASAVLALPPPVPLVTF